MIVRRSFRGAKRDNGRGEVVPKGAVESTGVGQQAANPIAVGPAVFLG